MSDDPLLDQWELCRRAEALIFAAKDPVSRAELAAALPSDADLEAILTRLRDDYANRGIHLVEIAGRLAFRTAPDLAFLLRREVEEERRLSRAGVETLAIIAYHQPVTRADIEDIRGVAVSKGTLDVLVEAGWVRPRGRRQTPGRPMLYGTSTGFLDHFGLESLDALPGVKELKAMGLLDAMDPAFADQSEEAGKDERQIDLEDAIEDSFTDEMDEEDP